MSHRRQSVRIIDQAELHHISRKEFRRYYSKTKSRTTGSHCQFLGQLFVMWPWGRQLPHPWMPGPGILRRHLRKLVKHLNPGRRLLQELLWTVEIPVLLNSYACGYRKSGMCLWWFRRKSLASREAKHMTSSFVFQKVQDWMCSWICPARRSQSLLAYLR